ncbi:MAG: hypothetical protein JWM59_3888 [Verrucomicrobiales bacterium]|nr:hypothetical protein [Verrucomicrobiales bacterium]
MVSFFRLLFKRAAPASAGESQASEKRTGKAARTKPGAVSALPTIRPGVRVPAIRPVLKPVVAPPPEPVPEVPDAVDPLRPETTLPASPVPLESAAGSPDAALSLVQEAEEEKNPAPDSHGPKADSSLPAAAAPVSQAAPVILQEDPILPTTVHERVPGLNFKDSPPAETKAAEAPEYPAPIEEDAGLPIPTAAPPEEPPAVTRAGTAPPQETQPAKKAEPVPPISKPGILELGLRGALRTADPLQLGFDPAKIPVSVRLVLPLELVRPQMVRGRVEIGLEDLRNGVLEKYRPAFARSVEGLRVAVPLSEIFPLLPQEAIPSLAARKEEALTDMDTGTGFAGLEFVTPFSENAREEESLRPVLPAVAATPLLPPLMPVPGLICPTVSAMTASPGGPGLGTDHYGPAQGKPAEARKSGVFPDLVPIAGAEPEPGITGEKAGTAPLPADAAGKSWPGLQPLVQCSGVLARPPGSPAAAAPEPVKTGGGAVPLPVSTALSGTPAKPVLEPSPLDADDDDDLGEAVSAAALAEPPFHPASLLPLPPLSGSPAVNGKGPGHVNGHAGHREYAPPVPPELPPHAEGHARMNGKPPSPSLGSGAGYVDANNSATISGCGASAGPPLEDLNFGCLEDITQTTLRAVLGTNQMLTAQAVLDHCAALPGLKACGLLRGAHSLSCTTMSPGEARTFLASAARTLDSLKMLSEAMGLGEGGNFTLRTDQGIRSFFLGNGLCLVVWHEMPVFSSGTREKLMLVARNFPA